MPAFNPITGWQPVQTVDNRLRCAYCEVVMVEGEEASSIFNGDIGKGKRTGLLMVVASVKASTDPFDDTVNKDIIYHRECIDAAYLDRIMEENGMGGFPDCTKCGGPVTVCEHCGHNASSME